MIAECLFLVATIGGSFVGSTCMLLICNLPRRWMIKDAAQHMAYLYRPGRMPRTLMTPAALKLDNILWVSLVIFLVGLLGGVMIQDMDEPWCPQLTKNLCK